MTDTATQEAPAPKRRGNPEGLAKARAARKANLEARKAAPPKPLAALQQSIDELEGLTADDCADECRDGYCVITHLNHCGHPAKGGIQAAHQVNPEIKARYNRAKRMLRHLAADQKIE